MHRTPRFRNFILAAGLLALAACADYTNEKALNDPDANSDPYEGFNRAMFGVNKALDTVLVKPVTDVYRFIVPETGRKMVDNFVSNLETPVVLVNSVLQGDQENTFATFWRFALNSSVGIGGLFDVASEGGLHNRSADFGQTMAVWGVGSGPYTYVPIFGPGTIRDSFGRIVDIAFNPLVWVHPTWYSYAQAGVTIVDRRSVYYNLIDDTYKSSLDPYATFRSGYLQKRTSDITKVKRRLHKQYHGEQTTSTEQTPSSAHIQE